MRHTTSLFLSLSVACVVPESPEGEGTEIGDEGGGWSCDVETREPVMDPDAVVNTLGASTMALLAAAAGDFSGTDVSLSLLADASQAEFLDYEPYEMYGGSQSPPECPDRLVVPAALGLVAPDFSMAIPSAWLSFGEDGSTTFDAALNVHWEDETDPDDDEGGTDEDNSGTGDGEDDEGVVETTLSPVTFDVDEMMSIEVVIEGEFDGDIWTLEAYWLATSKPQGEDANQVDYIEVIWTGTASAE